MCVNDVRVGVCVNGGMGTHVVPNIRTQLSFPHTFTHIDTYIGIHITVALFTHFHSHFRNITTLDVGCTVYITPSPPFPFPLLFPPLLCGVFQVNAGMMNAKVHT
jgi:hypothetical protein